MIGTAKGCTYGDFVWWFSFAWLVGVLCKLVSLFALPSGVLFFAMPLACLLLAISHLSVMSDRKTRGETIPREDFLTSTCLVFFFGVVVVGGVFSLWSW